jgi:hypothetical protein
MQMNKLPEDSSNLDKVFSLLRLAPDHHEEALAYAKSIAGEFGDAIRYALGGERVRIGPSAELWIAAARSRSPWSNDDLVEEVHAGLGPDAAVAASYEYRTCSRDKWHHLKITCKPGCPNRVDPALVTVRFHCDPSSDRLSQEESTAGAIRWQQSIWPKARESYFAQGAEAIAGNLDWWEARWQNRCYLEPLLDADVPLRPMAVLLIVVGLAAKEPGEQGLATECLIAAIRDSRIAGDMLGATMAQLWPTGLIKMARWAKTLADAARVSPLHSQVVFDALQQTFQGDGKNLPRDVHALLDLFNEIAIETGSCVTADSTRDLLNQLKGRGKAGKAAAALLACQAKPDPSRNTKTMQLVLEERLSRAERWTSRLAH